MLLHCHAGCPTEDVLAAARLAWAALYTETANWRPDPEAERQRRVREGLREWQRTEGRRLRDEFYRVDTAWHRDCAAIRRYALERLEEHRDDELGWELLRVAYTWRPPLDVLEQQLDDVDGARDDQERAKAFMRYREGTDATA